QVAGRARLVQVAQERIGVVAAQALSQAEVPAELVGVAEARREVLPGHGEQLVQLPARDGGDAAVVVVGEAPEPAQLDLHARFHAPLLLREEAAEDGAAGAPVADVLALAAAGLDGPA